MYTFQRIEELSIQCNDARKTIAEFLLNERSHIRHYSMQQIADMTFTSKSTLVRFAQNIGFSGWKEFVENFLQESHYQETHFSDIDPNMPFLPVDQTQEIVRKICKLQMESLQDTADIMDTKALEQAGDILLAANHIIIFGISPNTLLGELFKRKMESIGKLISISSMDESGMISKSLGKDDCAILISYSGNNETREPMRYIKTMKENKVSMIGITSGGENYIREQIDCILTISTHERLFTKISGFATEESIHFILNVLFAYCFAADYRENYAYKIQNSAELEYRRRTNLNEIKDDLVQTTEENNR